MPKPKVPTIDRNYVRLALATLFADRRRVNPNPLIRAYRISQEEIVAAKQAAMQSIMAGGTMFRASPAGATRVRRLAREMKLIPGQIVLLAAQVVRGLISDPDENECLGWQLRHLGNTYLAHDAIFLTGESMFPACGLYDRFKPRKEVEVPEGCENADTIIVEANGAALRAQIKDHRLPLAYRNLLRVLLRCLAH